MREEIFAFKTNLIEEYERDRSKLEELAEHDIEEQKDAQAERLERIKIQMDISDGIINKLSSEKTQKSLT